MQEIEIIKGEEFKIAVREEIAENDIFINEYRRAAKMLDEIVGASFALKDQGDNDRDKGRDKSWERRKDRSGNWSWKQQDFENNVIAICGERGEGKSSAMMTFVNAVYEMWKGYEDGWKEIFSSCRNLKQVRFAEPILIDPSMFDDVHNVLDIVLAKIFKNFSDHYERDNQCIDENKRERLLDQFQKVYRYLSLINNQKQMLDDEFDYEGNISKLSKLGESTNLKEELSKLVEEYLRFINRDKGNTQMLIAIDDLDLCSSNAYKMAEQIRKYLIIPNISIVLSVKIDQLELCVRERNLRDFEKIYQGKEKEVNSQLNREVQTMAERYVAKLIPRQRRIYLPKVQDFDEIHIVYKETGDKKANILWDSRERFEEEKSNEEKTDEGKSKKHKSFTLEMLDLIYGKTGMRFLPEKSGNSYLLPNNLRDMVSWITMIIDLEKPEEKNDGKKLEERDKIYYRNILFLKKYFENQWAGDNLMLHNGLSLQDLGHMDIFHLHAAVRKILEEICYENNVPYNAQQNTFLSDRQDGFFQVMGLFEHCMQTIVDIDKEAYIYRLRALYTIRMNSFLRDHKNAAMSDFLNGYIWGPYFKGVLPVHQESRLDRSRFPIGTVEGYNRILREINGFIDGLGTQEYGKGYKVPRITDKEGFEDYFMAWIILGLLSNVYYSNSNQRMYSSEGMIIFNNSQVSDYVQISLENYLVGLCNLEILYDKVNMAQLGVTENIFKDIVKILKRNNQESIRYAKEIVFNTDLAIGIKEYCTKHREYKKRTENEQERSEKLVETFFRNIGDYLKQCGVECDWTVFGEFNTKKGSIDITSLYATLFELSIQNEPLRKQQEEDKEINKYVSEFRQKLTEIPKEWDAGKVKEYTISPYFRNASADRVKENLEKLASAVQQYNGLFQKQPEGLDVDGLCDLYGYVVETYLRNSGQTIKKERHEEYKKLVRVRIEIKEKTDSVTSTI